MKDLNGCNNEAEEAVQLEPKWDPLKVQDSEVVVPVAVPELTVVLGGYLCHGPFFFLTQTSTFFFCKISLMEKKNVWLILYLNIYIYIYIYIYI